MVGTAGLKMAAVDRAIAGSKFRANTKGRVQKEAFRIAASAAANPLGRGVEMDDAAALVEALCHPGLEMVNGQTITVDGGLSL